MMNSRLNVLSFLLTASFLSSQLQGEEAPATSIPVPITTKEASHLQFTIIPKSRALDFLQAFTFLRQEKTAFKVAFMLKDGSSITNIIDITLMDQGSLFIIRYNSGQGIKFRVLGLEEILRLEPL